MKSLTESILNVKLFTEQKRKIFPEDAIPLLVELERLRPELFGPTCGNCGVSLGTDVQSLLLGACSGLCAQNMGMPEGEADRLSAAHDRLIAAGVVKG